MTSHTAILAPMRLLIFLGMMLCCAAASPESQDSSNRIFLYDEPGCKGNAKGPLFPSGTYDPRQRTGIVVRSFKSSRDLVGHEQLDFHRYEDLDNPTKGGLFGNPAACKVRVHSFYTNDTITGCTDIKASSCLRLWNNETMRGYDEFPGAAFTGK
ncbi:hypothetical protein BDV18DRAFT_161674 [Aspergillus unguis]